MIYRNLSSVKLGDRMEYGYRGGWGDYLPVAVVEVSEVGKNWFRTGGGPQGEGAGMVEIGFIVGAFFGGMWAGLEVLCWLGRGARFGCGATAAHIRRPTSQR